MAHKKTQLKQQKSKRCYYFGSTSL